MAFFTLTCNVEPLELDPCLNIPCQAQAKRRAAEQRVADLERQLQQRASETSDRQKQEMARVEQRVEEVPRLREDLPVRELQVERHRGLRVVERDEDLDQILGLELGADDYIAKPVQPRLLLARIKALLRRAPTTQDSDSENADGELAFGSFRISQATRSTHLGSESIELTTAEFDLLWLLASHAGSVLSRDDLLQQLRGIGFDGLDRSIDARISRLRRKLGDDPENPTRIKTVRGKGYLFSKHDW